VQLPVVPPGEPEIVGYQTETLNGPTISALLAFDVSAAAAR
jgi:hypothetical protein